MDRVPSLAYSRANRLFVGVKSKSNYLFLYRELNMSKVAYITGVLFCSVLFCGTAPPQRSDTYLV